MSMKCTGSQAFPTAYNGENTRCPVCHRLLKLGVNGKVPNHNDLRTKVMQ